MFQKLVEKQCLGKQGATADKGDYFWALWCEVDPWDTEQRRKREETLENCSLTAQGIVYMYTWAHTYVCAHTHTQMK